MDSPHSSSDKLLPTVSTDQHMDANINDELLDVPDPETTDYLKSFNIDMGTPSDAGHAPHYIVNLNEYVTDMSVNSTFDNIATLPVGGQLPSTSVGTSGDSSYQDSDKLLPSPLISQLYLKSPGRGRGRGKGRSRQSIPLDDVVEKKIVTFEGRDCVQQLEELLRLFPRFKRAYINRVFTRNMLNFDKTFEQLNEEHQSEMARFSSVRLIPGSKPDPTKAETKSKGDIPPLNPQGMLYLDVPLGRCPPQIASTLYRRVIVNPDGSVESADEHEQKYMNVNGLTPPPLILKPPVSKVEPEHAIAPLFGTHVYVKKPAVAPSPVAPVPSSAPQEPTSSTTAPKNRFFRSNRTSQTEIKKREYVDRELRQTKSAVSKCLRETSQLDNSEISQSRDEDAAQYMASVGVVSTPASKKRATKTTSKADSAPPVDEVEEPIIDDGLKLTNTERKNILEFFNSARIEELALLPGCSHKTAQVFSTLRPFQNMNELVTHLQNTRYLSVGHIDACKELLQMRTTIIRLLQRCGKITERVNGHVSNLLSSSVHLTGPNSGSPNPSSVQLLMQQPAILNPVRELKPYQMVGLNWLRLLDREKVNGILADEMGLGKTVQAIAFLASLWESGDRGPHLIICPSSTQDNWQRELADWCSHLKVLVYQGPADQRKSMRLQIYEKGSDVDFNILLTSYAIGTSTIEDRALLKRVEFHYGIFDEAHMLKNMSSQRYRHLSNFRVQRRLLLTGTPLQNNLLELVSLLTFLMPEMFSRSTDLLKRMFQMYSSQKSIGNDNAPKDTNDVERSSFELERLEQAKNLLKPFFLRRLKTQVLDQLPPKTNELIRVKMTEPQAKYYWNLVDTLRQATRSSSAVNNGIENNEQETNDSIPPVKKYRPDDTQLNGNSDSKESPSNMIIQLRKAANHHALLSGINYSQSTLKEISESLHLDPTHNNSHPQLIYEDLCLLSDHQVHKVCQFYESLSPYVLSMDSIMSGSGKLLWLDENIPKLIKSGHRLLIFSQFIIVLDLLEEYLLFKNFRYLRLDGKTPVVERQDLIDRFNSSSIEVFLLSTRAGGMGVNLTGADTVIIHDIDFNPYNDKQAEDRVHRLGQTKPVHVIRLVSEGTIEEGILRIATDKLQLEQDVTGPAKPDSDEDDTMNEELVADDELSESTDVVMKILGTAQPTTSHPVTHITTSARLADTEFRSLLEDTLKQRE